MRQVDDERTLAMVANVRRDNVGVARCRRCWMVCMVWVRQTVLVRMTEILDVCGM